MKCCREWIVPRRTCRLADSAESSPRPKSLCRQKDKNGAVPKGLITEGSGRRGRSRIRETIGGKRRLGTANKDGEAVSSASADRVTLTGMDA